MQKKIRNVKKAVISATLAGIMITVGVPTIPSVMAAGVETQKQSLVDLTIDGQSWGSNYGVNATLTNFTGKAVEDWKIVCDKELDIDSIWCSKVTKENGKTVIVSADWNKNIAANGSIQFGFNGNGSMPTNAECKVVYKINGVWNEKTVSEEPTVVPTEEPTQIITEATTVKPTESVKPVTKAGVNFKVESDSWDSNYNMSVTISNTTSNTVEDWKVTVPAENIDIASIWCAKITKEENKVVITPLEYNKTVAGNQSVNFGLNGKGSISKVELTVSYKVNGRWYLAGTDTETPTEEPTVVPTTVVPTTVAPTTVAPTTVAPTTVAPTTVVPTTVAPTTVAPTTEAPTVAPSTEVPTQEPTSQVDYSNIKVETLCPTELTQTIAGVKYGNLVKTSYYSTTCEKRRNVNILLPAGYSKDKKYPVLYVLHGIFGDENSMVGYSTLYGNMMAKGICKDMIVVYPYMYASKTQDTCTAIDDENSAAYDNFVNDLADDLMPFMAANYSVAEGRENTAVTGFSMGGREALAIGFARPDLFGYVCGMAPAPGLVPGRDWAMYHKGTFAESDIKFTNEKPYLLMVCSGDRDSVVGTFPQSYHELFDKNGVEHVWWIIPGSDHGDPAVSSGVYNFTKNIFR